MSDAAELREALGALDIMERAATSPPSELTQAIIDAARTIALPILEAAPELVERIADIIAGGLNDGDHLHEIAASILAAISTPTPGAQ